MIQPLDTFPRNLHELKGTTNHYMKQTCRGPTSLEQRLYYHPRMRVGNVFGHVCLSVCLSVCLCVCLSVCVSVC